MRQASIGVIDIGKTHIKLYLLGNDTDAAVLNSWQTDNAVVDRAPYPHFDTERHWRWLQRRLRQAAADYRVDKLITTAHGASMALLSGDGLALPILDYEHDGPDACGDYPAPPFRATFSPPLPLGLNVGRQLFWQQRRWPEAFAGVSRLLPYPQYWGWRLSGVAANEVSSIGAHTDLWLPRSGEFSELAKNQGWDVLFPPLRRAWESLGPPRPELVTALGLPADCQILVGLHDSNASLLPHLISQTGPFTVVSTGTWVIIMSVGADLDRLDPREDTLANVNVLGEPVACARFMGGREYALLTDGADAGDDAVYRAAAELIGQRVYALPNWTQSGGPLPGRQGEFVGAAPGDAAGRVALASLYCALMVDRSLSAAGADEGPLIIEGSFIKNALFCEVLGRLRPRQQVLISSDFAGTTRGAAILANWPERGQMAPPDKRALKPRLNADVGAYAAGWRRELARRG